MLGIGGASCNYYGVICKVFGLFHFTLRIDLAFLAVTPLFATFPHRHTRTHFTSSPPPCLIGTDLHPLWRCVPIQLVCVMLCCPVLLGNGLSGLREQLETHKHSRAQARQKVFPQTHNLPSSSPYRMSLREHREVGSKCVLLFRPGASSKHLGIALSVMTTGSFPFPFPLKQKCHGNGCLKTYNY